MKKLLFIILTILFATELFAYDCKQATVGTFSKQGRKQCGETARIPGVTWLNYPTEWDCKFASVSTNNKVVSDASQCNQKKIPIDENLSSNKFCFYSYESDKIECITNPQPKSNSSRCADIFEKDGIYHTCDPNTNISRPEPDMELIQDPETGESTYGCKNGKIYGSSSIIGSYADGREFIPYIERTCSNPSTGGGSTGGGSTGGGSTGGGSTGGGSTGGGETGTGGGSTGGGSTGGGSTGGGSTGGGSTGGGSTGGGDTGTGGGETPPIDQTPATCEDSSLNLQEKMLCEMNKGIKKLNSESTPSNSLNQLMKDLNFKSTEQNETLDGIRKSNSSLNEKISQTNTKLDNLNTSTSTTNTKLDNLNTTLGTLNTTLKDIEKNTKTSSSEGEGQDISLDSINSKGDSISSGIDSLFDIYSTFSSNIQNQFSNIKTQIEDTKSLIVEPSNIFNKTEVSSCPTSYTIDFSSFGIPNKIISIDFCQYTSSLKPLVYFFVYITLMIGLISLCFRFIGVII